MQVRGFLVGLLALAALLPTAAPAQEVDAVERLDEAMRRPQTVADTVLVFTNLGNAASRVHLAAYDASGALAGEDHIAVAANGLAYVLASDLVKTSEPRRFIGKVVSRGGGRLAASAVLVAGTITDVPTIVSYGRTAAVNGSSQAFTAATFPLVATY
jgi:hypothetical protein